MINGEVRNEKGSLFIESGMSLTIEVNLEKKSVSFSGIANKKSNFVLDEELCKGEWFVFASLR